MKPLLLVRDDFLTVAASQGDELFDRNGFCDKSDGAICHKDHGTTGVEGVDFVVIAAIDRARAWADKRIAIGL